MKRIASLTPPRISPSLIGEGVLGLGAAALIYPAVEGLLRLLVEAPNQANHFWGLLKIAGSLAAAATLIVGGVLTARAMRRGTTLSGFVACLLCGVISSGLGLAGASLIEALIEGRGASALLLFLGGGLVGAFLGLTLGLAAGLLFSPLLSAVLEAREQNAIDAFEPLLLWSGGWLSAIGLLNILSAWGTSFSLLGLLAMIAGVALVGAALRRDTERLTWLSRVRSGLEPGLAIERLAPGAGRPAVPPLFLGAPEGDAVLLSREQSETAYRGVNLETPLALLPSDPPRAEAPAARRIIWSVFLFALQLAALAVLSLRLLL